MKVQPVVKRDTLRLAVGMVAPVVLTVLGFWGAGRLDYTVVLGALLGYLVTVGNFFLLALTIQNNTEMAEREGEKNPLPPEPEQDPDDPENQKDVMETIMGKKTGAELPEYAQRAKRNSQLSYIGRVALMAILLLAAAVLPCFNVLAALIPLLLQRFVLMILSGIYREEEFWKNRQVSWIELQDVCGTNCYCDEEAIAEINKRTENYPTAGIHFIDSGNYHYMTRLWLTRMDQPFCLLVYDNHTDMQPPAFGGILSCGGWIAAALEELENLKYVILVGPDEAAYEQVDENLKDRVIFLSREKLQVMNDEERNWFLRETVSEVCNWRKSEGLQEDAEKFLPLYISVDKDVLCTEDAQTTWSQGDMRLTTLVSGVQTVLECAKESSGKIAGVDICGEADAEAVHENEANDYANEKLLEVFEGLFGKSDCE